MSRESTVVDGWSRRAGHGPSRREVTKAAAAVLFGSAAFAHGASRRAAAQDATPGTETCPTTSEEENIALVQRYWDEIWTAGGDAAVVDLLTEDEIHHWGLGGTTVGLDAFRERLVLFLDAFPDFAIRVEQAIADGDLVLTRWVATGTHEGVWLGLDPTGTTVEYGGMNLFRIECGKIVESWGAADHLSLLHQLGALPNVSPPAATPTA